MSDDVQSNPLERLVGQLRAEAETYSDQFVYASDIRICELMKEAAAEIERLQASLTRVRGWIESTCPDGCAEEAFRD